MVTGDSMTDNEDNAGFALFTPFVIDGEGYSVRDRQMFIAGYEFALVEVLLESGDAIVRPIHNENTDRLRVLCGRARRRCEIERIDDTWSELSIEPIS